ncbi:MAG: hypothetical protein ACKOCZ_09840 [Betaproteobacteria bacterium]|nr:hypothetical protein [Betaproteobacteria bacterium]
MCNRWFFRLAPAAVLFLVACVDPVEKCVTKKQEAFRKANPKADYAVGSTANEKFRAECKASLR